MNKTIKNIFALVCLLVLPAMLDAQTSANRQIKNSPVYNNHPGVKQANLQSNTASATNTTTVTRLHGKSQDYIWDSITNSWAWQWSQEEITKYDSKGRLILDIQISDNVLHDTGYKQTASYGANGSVFNTYYGYQYSTVLQANNLDTTLIDNKGNQTRYVYYALDSTQKWILSSGTVDILVYNSSGNEISDLGLDVDSSRKWVNNMENIYAVNADGSWKTDTTKYWNINQWVNTGLNDSITWKTWNGINNSQFNSYIDKTWNGSTWQDSAKVSDTYNANGGTIEVDQLRNFGKWVDYTRESQFVDNLGNNTGSSNDTFNGVSWVETYGEQINYTYDANNNITQEIDQYYDIPSKQYINQSKEVYSDFTSYLGIKEASHPAMQISIYPNPATETLHLQSSQVGQGNAVISIYNMQGQIVITEQTSNNELSFGINIPVNTLSKGIYILRTVSTSGDINQEFIKQ